MLADGVCYNWPFKAQITAQPPCSDLSINLFESTPRKLGDVFGLARQIFYENVYVQSIKLT